MTVLRSWLLSVTACAVLVSIAEQLTYGSAMRAAVRFTGGVILLLALLRPLVRQELSLPAFSAEDYRAAVAELEQAYGEAQETALGEGIAEKTQAYIEDKAETGGARVRAVVKTEKRGDALVPVSVTLYGEKNEALGALIARELGITEEQQTWIEPEEENFP